MRNAAVLFGGVCVVAAGALFARLGLHEGLTGFGLALWRLTLAGAIVGVIRLVRGRGGEPMSRVDRIRLIAAGAFMALHFVTWITSLRYISVARSTLLVSTSPLFAGLAGLVVPSLRPGRWFWIGLGVAVIGVGLFTKPGLAVRGPDLIEPEWLGDVLAVAGAIFVVPYLILSQGVQQRFGTFRTVTGIYVASAAFLWLIAVPYGHASAPITVAGWVGDGGMALLSQLTGHTTLNWALRHFSAGQVTAATLMEPVFAAILAWIVLGEPLTPAQIVGGIIVIVGIGVAVSKPVESKPPATNPAPE